MTMENEVYYIYEGDACWVDRLIDEEEGLLDDADEDYTCTEVTVNPEHYYKGYFFFNDMDSFEDKDEHYPSCFNSMKDLDDYCESNNSSGHFQCTYVEEWVDGVMVGKVDVQNEDWLGNA